MAFYALVMAGGVGTRLWPLSRSNRPKQSLKLVGERTMFEHAVDRIAPLFQRAYEFAKPPSKPVLYMAQGLAVVATKTPPYMDLIESGKNGFLVDRNDPRRWQRFLEVLLTDENIRNSFIAQGKISCQLYSASAIARQWDKFLSRVIKR